MRTNCRLYLYVGVVLIFSYSPFVQLRILSDNSKYLWKTTGWEECRVLDGAECGKGIRVRGVSCWWSEGDDSNGEEAVAPTFCDVRQKPHFSRPCFIACQHHKGNLEWKVSDWGPCMVAENQLLDNGIGLTARNVTCLLSSDNDVWMEVDEENCFQVAPRPEPINQCTLPVRQDCVTTDWTEWSPCCDHSQFRTRTVLTSPKNDGAPCPDINEWKKCEKEDSSCSKHDREYKLRVEPWEECAKFVETGDLEDLMFNSLKEHDIKDIYFKHGPEVGTQKRSLACMNATSEPVDLKFCETKPLPSNARACIIPRDCVVSSFSEWVIKQEGCIDYYGKIIAEIAERKRYIIRTHEGQGLRCPPLTEKRLRKDGLAPCANKYKWLVSKWSACLEPITFEPVECGGGIQVRNATCVDAKSGQPLNEKLCKSVERPPLLQRCEMACPRDCEVSEWGAWGSCLPNLQCSAFNFADEKNELGWRTRYRNVIVPPSALGMECPSLSESQMCSGTECYTWSAGSWGSCQLDSGLTKCGSGHRTRQVYCITHNKEIVNDSKCVSRVRPEVEEGCNVPCAYDCVVSSWSEWSPCSLPCSTSDKKGRRRRYRSVIAPVGPGGHPCPKEEEMSQEELCNTFGCEGYSWLTLPWQNCNATCDTAGLEKREVWCVANNEDQVDKSYCSVLPMPNEFRSCTNVCESGCRLSEWSPWNACPDKPCEPIPKTALFDEESQRYYRRRTRISLNGQFCGALEEREECQLSNKTCPVYKWKSYEWTGCQMPHGAHCGPGLRTREIRCIEDGSKIEVELRHCFAHAQGIPASVQRCRVDCHVGCQLTEWTPWPTCAASNCTNIRIRTRQLIGNSVDHSGCAYIPLQDESFCECGEHQSAPSGEWSNCILNEANAFCGNGTKFRTTRCYNNKGEHVDPRLCADNGIEEETCEVPCPVDCILAGWSAWSVCSATCGPGMQNRTNKVLQYPKNGGRQCPEIFQEKPCNIPCSNFQWRASPWTECKLDGPSYERGCGSGEIYRRIGCFHVKTNTEVQGKFCDWNDRPETISTCHIYCPGDCVLSEWSDWSPCSKRCEKGEQQQRTRSLLRGKSADGAKCSHSIETRPCELNVTCFTYQWAFTPFSSCLPLGGSPCGEGITTKTVYCQRSDMRPVDDSYCSHTMKPSPEEKWCYVDCPVDCQVDAWTPWNVTNCKCTDTGMSRSYSIKILPSPMGRQCPETNEQWKPCPPIPCYKWIPSTWSHCQLHGATCGIGVTTRNLTCIRQDDSEPVDAVFCVSLDKPSISETCYIPCNNDCQLSQWSEWSDCHGDCKDNNIGYQTRSRTVIHSYRSIFGKACPEPLWETRDCVLTKCPLYEWKINERKELICQRSDGKIVESGYCDWRTKPSDRCVPLNSRCYCLRGFRFDAVDHVCPKKADSIDDILQWLQARGLDKKILDTFSPKTIIFMLLAMMLIWGVSYVVIRRRTKYFQMFP